MYVHVQALYNWWFARNLLAILVSRQSGFYICPGFVFIVTNRVVLSYSTNMLVFRANTNLLCTNVAWLSNLWRYPQLVGVSRYLGWHYWCYYWISLAVGGDVLITTPLIDIKVVPWVWATQVAIHTFARGINSAALTAEWVFSAHGPKMARLWLIDSITPTYMTMNDKWRNSLVFKGSWNQQYLSSSIPSHHDSTLCPTC